MKKSENMNTFAKLVSDIVGEAINPEEHIHIGSGRAYYIQPTLDGAPMLLRHYRGSLFIDMSEADYNAINSGSIDAEKYVNSSNWLLGYYWGGGSMVGGGYYQPIDLVNRSEDVKRYIRILSCRTSRVSSGYRPTEDQCTNCSVKNCPFSTAECNKGILENETIQEKDPRHDIFKLVLEKFENQFPGYTLRGMLSAFKDGDMKENECLVRANKRYQENDPYSLVQIMLHGVYVDPVKAFVRPLSAVFIHMFFIGMVVTGISWFTGQEYYGIIVALVFIFMGSKVGVFPTVTTSYYYFILPDYTLLFAFLRTAIIWSALIILNRKRQWEVL